MKKIHDILKARKKHLHATHIKKQPHTDFHAPIFDRPLFDKGAQLSALSAAIAVKSDAGTKSKRDTAKPKPDRPLPAAPAAGLMDVGKSAHFHRPLSTMRGLPGRFFSIKGAGAVKRADSGEEGTQGEGDALDKERIARLRELLNGIINHPGSLTPSMFWILFMKIAPHFSMMTAGCVRVSALFWLMLSYIKAKNKTKKRKLKEQLVAAAEWLEKDEESAVRPRRR